MNIKLVLTDNITFEGEVESLIIVDGHLVVTFVNRDYCNTLLTEVISFEKI